VITFLTILFSMFLVPGDTPTTSDIVRVTVPRLNAVSGTVATARLRVTVKDGYHIQANSVREEYLIPTVLSFQDDITFVSESVVFPPGKALSVGGVGEPWLVLDGSFDVVITFRVSAAQTGPALNHWRGILRYQACDQKRCFPPVSVEFDLPVEVL